MKSIVSTWATFSQVANWDSGPLALSVNEFQLRYLEEIPAKKLLTQVTVAQAQNQGQIELEVPDSSHYHLHAKVSTTVNALQISWL